MSNYWDELMATDEGAADYMMTYGEGPGCETRRIIGRYIDDGDSVLDVGCGPGWNLDHFAEYGPAIQSYKGSDYSERFVRVANIRRKDLKARGQLPFPAFPFELQDCRDLPEPNRSWDIVIIQDCLEHTNGYEKPVREALRVARYRVIISFWKPFRTKDDGDQINDDGNDGYGSNYEQAPWEKFLDSLGFQWSTDHTSSAANRQHAYYIIDKGVDK